MPKAKTHKGSAKRFKVTAGGKVVGQSSNRRHNLGKKSPDRKRRLRGLSPIGEGDAARVRKLLPYA